MNHAKAEQAASRALLGFSLLRSFGFVVTSSVAIAGVLLFSVSHRPQRRAMLFADRIGARLAIAGPWAR